MTAKRWRQVQQEGRGGRAGVSSSTAPKTSWIGWLIAGKNYSPNAADLTEASMKNGKCSG